MTASNRRERLTRFGGWVRHLFRTSPDAGAAALAYMDRYSLREQGPSGTNPWRVYLHHFLAPDDADHHNHPSAWSLSIVLWGSYTEQMLSCWDEEYQDWDALDERRVRWFNWIPATKYHRISELHPGPGAHGVWTLFVCGPLTGKSWVFWVPGRGHVDQAVRFAARDQNPTP